jgi:hypothetical protein
MSKAKTATVVILKTVAQQDKLFNQISNNRKALQDQMHQAAVSVLWHVAQHHNVHQFDKLMAALKDQDGTTAVFTNALLTWAEKFGPVEYDTATKKLRYVRGKETRLGAAMDEPFWKSKAQPEYQPLDMAAFIASAIKRIAKDEAEMESRGLKVDHSAAKTTLLALQKTLQAPAAQIEVKAHNKLQARKGKAAEPLMPAGAVQPQAPAQLPLQ